MVEGLGSTAFQLSQKGEVCWIEDLVGEIFFDRIPAEAAGLAAAFLTPLKADGLAYGSLVTYAECSRPPFDPAEREYWTTASVLIGLSLDWWSLKRQADRRGTAAVPGS